MMDVFFVKVAHASVDTFVRNANKLIINPIIVLLFTLAIAFFFYGVFEFMTNQSNEEKRTAGKKNMLFGVIGITIMMGVWFLMGLVIDTFGITGIDVEQGTVNLPNYPN